MTCSAISTRVDHPTGAATTFTYDLGGRKTAMADPDLGAWGYAYNRQSQLTRQTDARGQSICQYFDEVGRLAGKYFVSGASLPHGGALLRHNLRL